MPAVGPSAFISYSREDSEFALRLAQDLKEAGANVWLDQLELIPGRPWDNSIEDALLAAPQMLVVLSPTSVKSENVRDEISYALKQGKTVIPVLYMECVIPLRLERKQHIDFRTDYAQGLAHLLKYLGVAQPDPSVLEKAAAGDAQRRAAWQAREAEALRLRELSDHERQDTERKANEDLRQRQEAEELQRRQAAERLAREAEAARIRQEEERRAKAAEQNVPPPPMPPPMPLPIPRPPEAKTGLRKVPIWGWATIAAVVLVAVFAAGRFFAPKPTPQSQPAASPSSNSDENIPAINPIAPSAVQPALQAMYNQAVTLHNNKNDAGAATLFTQACSGGMAAACGYLAWFYVDAMGVPQNYATALTLSLEACNGGNGLGCNEAGWIYEHADGVSQDYSKAVGYYSRACDLGHSTGCNNFGLMYWNGTGVSKDYVQADQAFAKACDGSDSWGCTNLGESYRDGEGVAKDLGQARTLLQKGCNLGDQQACTDLQKL